MRKLFSILLLLVAVYHPGNSWGDTATPSTDTELGLNADNVKLTGKDKENADVISVATQRAVRILSKDWAQFAISKTFDYIGNLCLRMLFYVYDNYVGSFLIYIPDMANQYTYMKAGAPDGQAAANVINSLLMVSRAIGVFFLITLFVAYVGQGASGLSNITFTGAQWVRFITVFVLLCAWSPIFSVMTQLFTAIGYSFYTSCSLHTGQVLSSLTNFNITDAAAPSSAGSLTTVANGSRSLLINYTGLIYFTVYFVAIALIAVGLIIGFLKFSGGDRTGMTRIISGALALVLITALPFILNSLVAKGVVNIGNKGGNNYQLFRSSDSFTGTAKPALPGVEGGPTQSASGSGTTTSNLVDNAKENAKETISTEATGAAGFFKIVMSIWGLFIVVGVLFMKFSQVILLGILFILGPIFIGLAAHPSTASISMGALRLFVKLLAYSPIWALTLVMLYIIPNIDFGVADLGVNSLLTAFAVFAGLQVVSDTKELAGLFSNFGGAAGGGNISAMNPISMVAGGFLGATSKVKSAASLVGAGAKTAAVATPQGAALAAGTQVASMALKGGNPGGQGGLTPNSPITPKNMSGYVDQMNRQPSTQSNVENISRVMAARTKAQSHSAGADPQTDQLNAIRSRMKSQLGGK